MKTVFYITLVSLIFSCSSESATNENIDTNKKTESTRGNSTPEEYFTKKTGKFYGCLAVYRTEESRKSIITTLKTGGLIDSLSPELVTSRSCYVLFTQLRDSSAISYDTYECEIIQPNGDTITNSYTKDQLEMFEIKSGIANKLGDYIKSEEYEEMTKLFTPEISEISSQFLKSTFEPLNNQYGKVKATRLVGFTKFKTKEIKGRQIELFVVKIAQERQHKIVTLGLVMTTNKDDLYIYGIN